MNESDYLANLLGAFSTAVSTQIAQRVADLGGHSLSHESALVAIRNHPDDTIDVLSRVLGLTHSGAVRLINTLEEEALVERHQSKEDARAVVLRVTRKGRRRVDQILKARAQITAQILANFTDEQQQALTQLLEVALGGLTGGQEEARRICRLCNEQICRSQGCPVEMAISDDEMAHTQEDTQVEDLRPK